MKNERDDIERTDIRNAELKHLFTQQHNSQRERSDIIFQKYNKALQRVSELKEEQREIAEKHILHLLHEKMLSDKREKINTDAKHLLQQLNSLKGRELHEKVNARRALLQNEESPIVMAYPVKKSEGVKKAAVRTPRKRKQRRRRRRSINKKSGV